MTLTSLTGTLWRCHQHFIQISLVPVSLTLRNPFLRYVFDGVGLSVGMIVSSLRNGVKRRGCSMSSVEKSR